MICSECARLGLKSTLRDAGGGYTTLMGYDSFYGEDGRYHMHDPNSFRGEMICSQGHRLRVVRYSAGCTATGCGWKGGDNVMEVVDAKASR